MVIDNIEQFKVFFEEIYELTDLLELQIFPEKVVCSILDKSKTRFMNAEYKKEFFSVYDVDEVSSVTIFADDIYKTLKTANRDDTLTLSINDTHMICKLEKGGNSRIFEFVLPNEYTESPTIPSLESMIDVDIEIDTIKQSIKDLSTIGTDLFEFNIANGSFNIKGGSSTTANYTTIVDVDVDESISAVSMFSLDYIKQLINFSKISKIVNLGIGDGYPLLYKISDDVMGVTIMGMIAPRLSEYE